METKQDFKEQFFSLAKFLGSTARTMHDHLGKYDDISEDEHRAYVWFRNTKASFYVGNNDIVGWVSAPKADAYGNLYLEEPEFFSIDGIKQGMTKEEVQKLWGQPDWKAQAVWGYKNRGGSTDTGQNFELCVEFSEADNIYKVSHFEARIIKPDIQNSQTSQAKPKSGCFIATACYGDYDAKEVLILREFRDNVLLNSSAGRAFVKFYYFVSPPFANIIEKSSILRLLVRKSFLSPIIHTIKLKQ